MHTITVNPGGANETVIPAGKIDSLNPIRTHTGLGDFRAEIAGVRDDLPDTIFDEVHIEDGDTFLFRGYLEILDLPDGGQDDETTRIGGRGIGRDLLDAETTRTFTNVLASSAIDTYWSEETGFTATVTTPTADTIVTDEQAQEANTDAEFTSATSLAATDPFVIQSDRLDLAQSGYFIEAENASTLNNTIDVSDANFSGGSGEELQDSAIGDIQDSFTFNYEVPSGDGIVAFRRDAASTHPDFDVVVDGQTEESFPSGSLATGLQWSTVTVNQSMSGSTSFGLENTDTGGGDTLPIDCLWIGDGRFNYTFDNSVDGNGWLSGPELYPDAASVAFDEVTTPYNIAEATLAATLNDTSNQQRLQLRLNQQTYFPNDGTEDNTSSVTTTFGNEFGTDIQGRARLSRFPTDESGTSSPTNGFNGQQISSWEITYDGDGRAVLDDYTVEGSHLNNLQTLHSLAGMRFVVDHAPNSKTAESFRAGDRTQSTPDWTIVSRRKQYDFTGFGNHVTARGTTSGGNRLTQTLSDSASISQYGQRHIDILDVTLDTQADVDSEARKELGDRLSEADIKAEVVIVPLGVTPGFTYNVPFSDGTTETIPLEETRYSVEAGRLRSTLKFDFPNLGLAENITGIRGGLGTTKRGF